MHRASYEIDLAGGSRKLLLAALCFALAGIYCFYATRVLRAHWAAETLTPTALKRAADLEPGNAAHWFRLARYKFFIEQDVAGSLALYQTATKLNPHSARYWLDLAAADAVMGRPTDQEHALQEAISADPKSPRVAWEAGNFYLIRGNAPEAMRNFRTVAVGDAAMRPQALAMAWRSFHDAALLLDKIVPPQPAAYWDLLQIILESKDLEAADMVWNAILKLNQPFSAKEAFPWVNALLNSGQGAQAEQVWRALAKFDPSFYNYIPRGDNVVVNGSFEEPLLNQGFDWHYDRIAGVEMSVDRDIFHFGTRSIRIDFQARATSQPGLRQLVAVKPASDYELSGFLKAEHLQSAVGASLVMRDPATGSVLARSEPIDGSTGWVQRSTAFKIGPNTSLVEIGIGRAYNTNTLIKGTLWLDDVQLAPR
jgi:tetratricopeptide (TPR) repeat protein